MTTSEKILETSLRLFVKQGYNGTTVRDIATEGGISVGLLFHYFSGKQALLHAHLELAAQGMQATLGLLASKQPPLQIFHAIATMTTTGMSEQTPRLLYSLMNQPLPADDIPRHLRKSLDKARIIAASKKLIAKGQKMGEIRPGNPHALAVVFWGAVQGTAQILADQPRAPIPDAEWLVGILRVHDVPPSES